MPKKQQVDIQPRDRLLPRLTMFFFRRSGTAALIWLVIATFGIASYTTLLKREGFPSVNIPLVVVTGSYAVDDAEQVDKALAKAVSDAALKQEGASTVVTQSEENFFNATIQYDETVNGSEAAKRLEKDLEKSGTLPENVQLNYDAPYFGVTGGSLEPVDMTISVYDKSGELSLKQLAEKAGLVAQKLDDKNLSQAKSFKVSEPFDTVTNPTNGQEVTIQRTFDRFGVREGNTNKFYNSVVINVAGIKGFDAIQLDHEVEEALGQLRKDQALADVSTAISASNAVTIEESISELQRVLLEGLIVVLIVGSIVIAIRASLIIVVAMVTVLMATTGLLYLLGYSLNVITLFGLILSLSLIVDDTIIMTEALDAARRRNKNAAKAVEQATRKISRAMVAATLTAALSFAPLLFVGGILGNFIRAIPVTIISALLISLFTALILIPLFSKYLLLGRKQMGEGNVKEVAAGIEEKIAGFIARPMVWARHKRSREVLVGLGAIVFSVFMIGAGGYIFGKSVEFNIFPSTKDTNTIAVTLTYPPNIEAEQAGKIADEVDTKASQIIGENLVQGSYYGVGNSQTATLYVQLVPYGEREETAPQIVERLDNALKNQQNVKTDAYTLDVGPPISGFTVNINAENREAAIRLANNMAEFLRGNKLERPNGTSAKITEARVSNTDVYERADAEPVVKVTAQFDGTDTSTLTTIATDLVKDTYTDEKLASYGLKADDIDVDLGQESENQESFATLALAFPAVLLVIYILLAVQFRSLLQPLIIFMAIPFSFFGIAAGLSLTDNPFSFFTMLGFFALIGLSIKNTILLTDYANQARRLGLGPVDAAVEALHERFRPLIATSLTAVVSLIPLAITSPFWEALAVTLICGLLSSTFLVVTVFPYYYLGAEFLRWKTGVLYRKLRKA